MQGVLILGIYLVPSNQKKMKNYPPLPTYFQNDFKIKEGGGYCARPCTLKETIDCLLCHEQIQISACLFFFLSLLGKLFFVYLKDHPKIEQTINCCILKYFGNLPRTKSEIQTNLLKICIFGIFWVMFTNDYDSPVLLGHRSISAPLRDFKKGDSVFEIIFINLYLINVLFK